MSAAGFSYPYSPVLLDWLLEAGRMGREDRSSIEYGDLNIVQFDMPRTKKAEDAGSAIGRSNDEGIDGLIKEGVWIRERSLPRYRLANL